MKTFHIEYTCFGDPQHQEIDWEADNVRDAVRGLIRNKMSWGKIPREAVQVFKVDGAEIDEEEFWPF